MSVFAIEPKNVLRCLILLYILSVSLHQISIGFNTSLSTLLAALCVFFFFFDKSTIHKPANNLFVLFVTCLFLMWALSVCLGLSFYRESEWGEDLAIIINKPFLLNPVFMCLVSHIFIHDRDFLLLAMKVFLISSVSLGCIYVLIVLINLDQFKTATLTNVDVALRVFLTNDNNLPVLFSG